MHNQNRKTSPDLLIFQSYPYQHDPFLIKANALKLGLDNLRGDMYA